MARISLSKKSLDSLRRRLDYYKVIDDMGGKGNQNLTAKFFPPEEEDNEKRSLCSVDKHDKKEVAVDDKKVWAWFRFWL